MRVNEYKKEIMRRIKASPLWAEIITIVDRQTSGKFYLVGGKLYRTALEVIYGINAASTEADWDFLALKVERQHGLFTANWSFSNFPGQTERPLGAYPKEYTTWSARLEKHEVRKSVDAGLRRCRKLILLCKLDIIDVRDTQATRSNPQYTICGYFNAVPISIQAIAYDFETDEIIGDRGLWSIINKKIFLNPTFDLPNARYRSPSGWKCYFKEKETSTGCKLLAGKHSCYCYAENHTLLWLGCKCGGT